MYIIYSYIIRTCQKNQYMIVLRHNYYTDSSECVCILHVRLALLQNHVVDSIIDYSPITNPSRMFQTSCCYSRNHYQCIRNLYRSFYIIYSVTCMASKIRGRVRHSYTTSSGNKQVICRDSMHECIGRTIHNVCGMHIRKISY